MESRDDLIEAFMNETRPSHNTALAFHEGIVNFVVSKKFRSYNCHFLPSFVPLYLMNEADLSVFLLFSASSLFPLHSVAKQCWWFLYGSSVLSTEMCLGIEFFVWCDIATFKC